MIYFSKGKQRADYEKSTSVTDPGGIRDRDQEETADPFLSTCVKTICYSQSYDTLMQRGFDRLTDGCSLLLLVHCILVRTALP